VSLGRGDVRHGGRGRPPRHAAVAAGPGPAVPLGQGRVSAGCVVVRKGGRVDRHAGERCAVVLPSALAWVHLGVRATRGQGRQFGRATTCTRCQRLCQTRNECPESNITCPHQCSPTGVRSGAAVAARLRQRGGQPPPHRPQGSCHPAAAHAPARFDPKPHGRAAAAARRRARAFGRAVRRRRRARPLVAHKARAVVARRRSTGRAGDPLSSLHTIGTWSVGGRAPALLL
jgi:hypothetical protein